MVSIDFFYQMMPKINHTALKLGVKSLALEVEVEMVEIDVL